MVATVCTKSRRSNCNADTFTATLTFDGLTDYLPDDNTSSLLIHFPTTFQPGSDGDENLGCDHVHL